MHVLHGKVIKEINYAVRLILTDKIMLIFIVKVMYSMFFWTIALFLCKFSIRVVKNVALVRCNFIVHFRLAI